MVSNWRRKTMKFIAQPQISEEEISLVMETIQSGNFVEGKYARLFEKEFGHRPRFPVRCKVFQAFGSGPSHLIPPRKEADGFFASIRPAFGAPDQEAFGASKHVSHGNLPA